MKKIITLLILICSAKSYAQNSSYVYIEGAKEKQYKLELDGKPVPEYSANYVIIPQIAKGEHVLSIIENNKIVENFSLEIEANKQYGYKLNYNSNGEVDLITLNDLPKFNSNAQKNSNNKTVELQQPVYSKEAKKQLALYKAREENNAKHIEEETTSSNIVYSKEARRYQAEKKAREAAAMERERKYQEKIDALAKKEIVQKQEKERNELAEKNRMHERTIVLQKAKIESARQELDLKNAQAQKEKNEIDEKRIALQKAQESERQDELVKKVQAQKEQAAQYELESKRLAIQKAKEDAAKQNAIYEENKQKLILANKERERLIALNKPSLKEEVKVVKPVFKETPIAPKVVVATNAPLVYSKEGKKLQAEIAKREEEAKRKEQKLLEKQAQVKVVEEVDEATAIKIREEKRIAKIIAKEEADKQEKLYAENKKRLEDEQNERMRLAKEEKRKLKIGEITDNTKLVNSNEDAKKVARDAERQYAKAQKEAERQKEKEDAETKKLWAKEIADNKKAADEKSRIIAANNTTNNEEIERQKFEQKVNKVKNKLNGNCKKLVSESELEGIFQKLEAKYDDEARLKVIRKTLNKENCYLCKDIEQLAIAFNTQNGKFDFVRMVFPYIQNQEDYKTLENIFKFEPFKQKVRMEFGGEM